jgi:hypothetical protein
MIFPAVFYGSYICSSQARIKYSMRYCVEVSHNGDPVPRILCECVRYFSTEMLNNCQNTHWAGWCTCSIKLLHYRFILRVVPLKVCDIGPIFMGEFSLHVVPCVCKNTHLPLRFTVLFMYLTYFRSSSVPLSYGHHRVRTTEQVTVSVTLYTCIGDVLCSNLGGSTVYSDWYHS